MGCKTELVDHRVRHGVDATTTVDNQLAHLLVDLYVRVED